nr:MAG TPA: hypothetical protein [Caudoviricetes sp.]
MIFTHCQYLLSTDSGMAVPCMSSIGGSRK